MFEALGSAGLVACVGEDRCPALAQTRDRHESVLDGERFRVKSAAVGDVMRELEELVSRKGCATFPSQ